jgi:mannosyltransferase
VHHLPLYRHDRTLAGRPDDLGAGSALAARQLRAGDPVLYLPAIGRRSAMAYPERFRAGRDIALAEPGPESGTLYGREVGPGVLRHRLAAVERVWVVTEPYALSPRWHPSDPADRVKLTVLEKEFVPVTSRTRAVQGGVTLRLYVRRTATG